MIVHRCKVLTGEITTFTKTFETSVDVINRGAILKNHSATHLLQASLQNILGSHVQQQGSRVSHEDLRFDYALELNEIGES